MGNRADEQVRIDIARVVTSSLKATAVEIDGEIQWIPKSQIHSVCDAKGDEHVMVTPFIAKKLGY